MTENYFVKESTGPEEKRKGPTDEERYNAVFQVSLNALEHYASLHVEDVTRVILLTIQGANLGTVRKRAKFIESLGPGRRDAVNRFITQMVAPHYHTLFINPPL